MLFCLALVRNLSVPRYRVEPADGSCRMETELRTDHEERLRGGGVPALPRRLPHEGN